MTKTGILIARGIAKEFIKRCDAVLKHPDFDDYIICGNKATGELRRESMELTRRLADMRKP
jgi:hypothetical protein